MLQLYSKNIGTAGGLNGLFQAKGIHAKLGLQPVVHHLNGISKLHRPPGNRHAGLGQQTERSIFARLYHQQAHLLCRIAQIYAGRIARCRGPAQPVRKEMPAFGHLRFQKTDSHQGI